MMAEDNLNQQEQEQKKGPGKLGTVVIVVMLIAIGIGLLSDDDEPRQAQRADGSFDADQARLEEQQQRERREQLAQQGSSSRADDGELDPFAAMSAMTRRQEMLEQQLSDATARLEEAEGSAEDLEDLKENYDRLEDQLAELTTMLKREAELSRSQDRQNAAALNDDAGDIAFDLEGGLSQSDIGSEDAGRASARPSRPVPVSPFGKNYVVLGGGSRNPITSQADPFTPTPATTARGEGLFDPQGDLDAMNPFASGSDGGTVQRSAQPQVASRSQAGLTPEYANVTAGYTGEERQAQSGVTQPPADGDDSDTRVSVPAFSFVEAATLHGLDCPIGADLPRTSQGNDGGGVTPGMAQPMPVVLPLRGKIRGPNGNVADLGSAHVMGWCIGKRVDRGEAGRAYIKVESISYWDRKGDPQYLNTISGDVISLVDNHRGIQAPVDEVRRSYLGEVAGAAALAAAATQLTESQFSETRTPEGAVRVFDGDRAKALAGKGGSAAMSQVAAMLNEEANMAYDTVRVPSGAPVRIMFMAPFEVTNLKLEVEDEILDAYDILI